MNNAGSLEIGETRTQLGMPERNSYLGYNGAEYELRINSMPLTVFPAYSNTELIQQLDTMAN